MKPKLRDVLIVCFMLFIMIAPALTIWGWIWQHHLDLLESQQNVMISGNVDIDSSVARSLSPNLLLTSQDATVLQPRSNDFTLVISSQGPIALSHKTLANILIGFIFAIPVGFWLGLSFSDRYRMYRATVRREQIAILERVWRHSIQP
ncbi:MAG TPA: hypothetical protein V6C78_25355 [Crinalium sp.]